MAKTHCFFSPLRVYLSPLTVYDSDSEIPSDFRSQRIIAESLNEKK